MARGPSQSREHQKTHERSQIFNVGCDNGRQQLINIHRSVRQTFPVFETGKSSREHHHRPQYSVADQIHIIPLCIVYHYTYYYSC